MVEDKRQHGPFVRMFGSAIIVQALLSATNFLVGLILIRRTTNADYGYFVLVTTASLLLTGLQNSFIQPPLVIRMGHSTLAERSDLIGGVYRGQRRVLIILSAVAGIAVALLLLGGVISHETGLVAIAAVASLSFTLFREFFRTVLLSFRRSQDVLKADLTYGALVLAGVPLATLTPAPAAAAVLAVALAALVGGLLLSRYLWRHEPWNPAASPGLLRDMAPIGTWAALGSGTHWAFSQGYNYVVAGALDVGAVAALAATRLLLMPVNLLSTGITSLMMATSSSWLIEHGPSTLFRRLLLIASALAAGALCYFVAVWLLRDFIFTHLMHKQFAQSGLLMIGWSAVFLVMLFRDQLGFFLYANGLHRLLLRVTALAAFTSLGVGYLAIRSYGAVGAPFGVLVGESVNLLGIIYLSIVQIRRQQREAQAAGAQGDGSPESGADLPSLAHGPDAAVPHE